MYQLPYIATEECLFYLRKSRTDDPSLTTAETLEKHEAMLDAWVERNIRDRDGNPTTDRVPEENRFREIVSGETIDSRPEVQAMLRKAESPKYKALVIVDPQRLSRGDLEDIGKLVKLLRYSKTIVCTLTYNYDLNDPHDRDSFERELKRGNEFLEYQKMIMSNGRLAAVEAGCYIGSLPPYGFDKDTIKRGNKTLRTLKENPVQAPIVRDIFRWYAEEGIGARKICDRLDAMGAEPPKGDAWSPDGLQRLFKNEHYIGMVYWNKRKSVRTVKNGEVVVSTPMASDYLIYDGLHDAIIEPELWEAVQKRIGKNHKTNTRKNLANPLAGVVFCSKCDRTMVRIAAKGEAVRLYCKNQSKCGTASVLFDDILAEVAKVLREAIEDFEIKIEAGADDSAEKHLELVKRLQDRLEELYELEVDQWNQHNRGKMPKRVFDRLNEMTAAEIETVQQELRTAQEHTPEPIDLQDRVCTFRAALDALLDPDAPVQEKNDLLKVCFERIEYQRDRTGVHKSLGPVQLDPYLLV